MADPTLTAAAVLAARWTPAGDDGTTGVILADLGTERSAPCVVTVDPARLLSDADAKAVVEHLCDAHNATLWVPLPPPLAAALTMVLNEVEEERRRQIAAGYDQANDDAHEADAMVDHIMQRLMRAARATTNAEHRRRLIQVAALAVAAVERWDRKHPAAPQEEPAHG
ncbi:hypothetical protein HL658_09880 [Azospirillum sp. RWY-5-1]|uniref:Uncharacterized protein n=1 Tax=Azospirillum oleiclasticum TaxID=2735135 RepID=A0ABX2T6U7_9PROT|nr:hypothetical protein [Azospirillum oleiclasticum]NYZ12861.1 hypothetical protein [Azospirillum oleiclasticum]NYZ20021.1 hypothetical protein [Azospirillum oleiclasticum]